MWWEWEWVCWLCWDRFQSVRPAWWKQCPYKKKRPEKLPHTHPRSHQERPSEDTARKACLQAEKKALAKNQTCQDVGFGDIWRWGNLPCTFQITCTIKSHCHEGDLGPPVGFESLAFVEKWVREKSGWWMHFWLPGNRIQCLTRFYFGSYAIHSNQQNAKALSETSTRAWALGRYCQSVLWFWARATACFQICLETNGRYCRGKYNKAVSWGVSTLNRDSHVQTCTEFPNFYILMQMWVLSNVFNARGTWLRT